MKEQFIGRERERQCLEEYLQTDRSEFIAVYGRRRVGKTFLVRQVVGKDACFQMTGVENANTEEQLSNFWLTLRQVYPQAQRCKDWLSAFDQLERYLEGLTEGRKIIFIDELPWMDTARSGFVSALGWFWNAWASARTDIKLIVCGSAASWMLNHLINDHGGLYNRVTHQLYVAPFTLAECKQFFDAYEFGYSEKDIAESYMVFGGIPYYMSLLQRGKSVAQNVDRLIVDPMGELSGEKDKLFRSLFLHSNDYVCVIEALSRKGKGLTRAEIVESTHLNNNQRLTCMLDELEKCNFIRKYESYGSKKRMETFQLVDPFVHFCYQIVEKNHIRTAHQWEHTVGKPLYYAWSGLAFEMLCLNHAEQLQQALGIAGMVTRVCAWRTPAEAEHGAQIDLVIERADRCVNICEMKFVNSEYEITKDERERLEQRMNSFANYTESRKTLLLTLITSFGVKTNLHSHIVQSEVTLHDLFATRR